VAAHIEAQSTHPIAQPIKEAYKGELDLTKVTNYNTSDSFEKREKKLFIV
jgi:cation transport ATPase